MLIEASFLPKKFDVLCYFLCFDLLSSLRCCNSYLSIMCDLFDVIKSKSYSFEIYIYITCRTVW